MLTEAQIEQRAHGLGSSDVSAVCGLNPHAGPLNVYNDKAGIYREDIGDKAPVIYGNYMEPGVLQHYADTHGVKLTLAADIGTVAHPEHPWAMATPDAIAENADGSRWLVEAKTAGFRVKERWGPAGTDEVPEEYLVQCQWQMFVFDLDRCDLHAAVDREFRTYTILRNDELIDGLYRHAAAFWTNLQAGIPPEIDGSDAGMRLLSSIHPEPKGERIEADAEAEALARELRELYRQADEIDARKKEIRAQLCERIGDARGMTTSVGSLSWGKGRETQKTDWKAVVSAIGAPPEVLAAHTKKVTTGRVFRPTWKKEESK